MNNNMQQCLQVYYESSFPTRQALQIRDLVSITTGWAHEMYAFDVEWGLGAKRRREMLVLRLYSGDDAYEMSEREFRNTKRLYDAGYPVPRVCILERTNLFAGKPFIVMDRIEGQGLWELISNSPKGKQRELHRLFCELLVRLHGMDWRPFVDDGLSHETPEPYVFADGCLASARAALRQHSLPGFLPIVEWLQERRDDVPCLQPTVIHGDFHFNNILMRNDGSPVVIDWTTLRVSDPRVDLAWTLLLQRTHVNVELRNFILQEYERLTEAKIPRIEWFEMHACLWRLLGMVALLTGGVEKLAAHAGTVTMVKQHLGPIKLVYEFLMETTGIKVAEVEHLFASVSS